jgi:hypothetical protein
MSVLMLLEWNDTPFEAYERVNEIMGISGDADAPPGLIEHVACVDGSGIVIADVWESEDALGRFFEERLGPALEEAGLPDTQPRIMETHNRLLGTSDDANVLVLVDIEGFSPAAYDQMTEQMDAHSGPTPVRRPHRSAPRRRRDLRSRHLGVARGVRGLRPGADRAGRRTGRARRVRAAHGADQEAHPRRSGRGLGRWR